jgi:hypothetical protein
MLEALSCGILEEYRRNPKADKFHLAEKWARMSRGFVNNGNEESVRLYLLGVLIGMDGAGVIFARTVVETYIQVQVGVRNPMDVVHEKYPNLYGLWVEKVEDGTVVVVGYEHFEECISD